MDRSTFVNEVVPLRDRCYRFAMSMLRNGPESEDVAQEVLLRLWDRRNDLTDVSNLEAFALRATRNMALDRIRHSSWRTAELDGVFSFASHEPGPDRRVEEADAVADVFNLMQKLPEIQRDVMHLREVEGLSYDEIASSLDLTVDQVRVYLHRARKKVCSQIDPSHSPKSSLR